MKEKTVFYLFILMMLCSSCKDKKTYVVEGQIEGVENSLIALVTYVGDDIRIDSVYAEDGKFTYTSSFYDTISPIEINMKQGDVWITAWVKNGEKIKISGNVDNPELVEIKGNEVNELLTKFRQNNKKIIEEKNDLEDKIKCLQTAENDSGYLITSESYFSQKNALEQSLMIKAAKFVEEHPSSIASLVLIQDYLLRNNNPGTIGNYLNLIESPAKEDKLFHRLHSAYQRALLTSVGSKAPDFAVNAINGDSLTLDSFHGRHLILAFEKPGSEACNEDHPVLDDLYKKYDRKKVEILSLVFDENPDDREKIAEEHKINWLQAIDTLGLASSSIFAYNISILPDYFLIDEEGVIRASHIPVKEIQILLEEKIESGK